jgi:hypothetical protein
MKSFLLGIVMLTVGASAFADSLTCDLSTYTASNGLTAAMEQDTLLVTWTGAAGTELRARYEIERAQPIVRELAVRKRGGQWAVLGQNLTPEFTVQTGRRRVAFSQLSSLKELGIDITPEILEREAWFAFWDAPFVVPGVQQGQNPMNPDLPRKPEEIRRAMATFKTSTCEVKTDGGRVEVNFPGLSMGIFAGSARFTVYRGTNLIRLEAIAKTDENMVAYKYDGGLKGFATATTPKVTWRDTGGNAQQYEFGGAVHDGPVTVRAKNRVMIAEGRGGSVAVFPPPTVFFHTREVDTNLGYVWYRKDAAAQYSIGVKQADHEDDQRYLFNYALYNAPPGTWQRMAVYFYASPEAAPPTREAVMAFTNNDTFKPIPGYKTMVNHFHIQFTDRLRASGSLNTQTPDLAAMKALGINIVGLSDFHADRLRARDPGPLRFEDQHDYFEASRRASDKDFLVVPWEEPNAYLGTHYNLLNPRPLYWSKVRQAGQPLSEQDGKYGKVYHAGSVEDMQTMMEAEGAFWFHAHPRTKSTTGYPDAIKDKSWVKSDRYLGVAFKPGMGLDLSDERLCDWRCFDAIDGLNNLHADSGSRPKYMIGDCDTYQKWPHDDLFPGFPVNYLKLDRMPGADEDWSPILRALRDGNFFVTTGEVYIKDYAVEGTGNKRTITADIEWTYPLEFVEVVWGDGRTVDRQIIRVTELPPFGTKKFSIPFDATGKKWVRLAVWDSAVNGAFVQPVWLKPTTTTTAAR